MIDSRHVIAGGLLLALAAAGFLIFGQPQQPKPFHIHADLKAYVEGSALDLSQARYMSSEGHTLSDVIHLHDMDGEVVHMHARGITLSEFFSSLNMTLNSTCIGLDDGTPYCDSGEKRLRMFVRPAGGEWNEVQEPGDYVFGDLDRILITYGNDARPALDAQMSSVTDKACIQSEKCPERGKPTDASCAGDFCPV
ncbi:MAG: hypothetical protein AB1529_00625 [Candidatus Micrarchaeota archaeon]